MLLEDRFFGRQLNRVVAPWVIIEGRTGEVANKLIKVVHRHCNAARRHVEH